MKDDFGWDFLVDESGDCRFTVDGDLEVVEGAALVAQDVRTAALSPKGSVFYAPTFGEGVVDMLRGNGGDVAQKLRDAALGDERVDWETIQTGQYETGKYFLRFSVLGDLNEQTLLFEIADVLRQD